MDVETAAANATGKTVEDATYYLAVEAHTSAPGKPIKDETRTMYRQKGGHLGRLLRVSTPSDYRGRITKTAHGGLVFEVVTATTSTAAPHSR